MGRTQWLVLGALLVATNSPASVPLQGVPDRAGAPLADSSEVGLHWRTPDALVAYDRRPELGISSPPSHYARVRELGMRLVRTTVYWDGDDTQSERALARSVLDAQRNGIELVVVVHSTSRCRERLRDPDGEYAAFVARLAGRFPSVRFWELWNEQDAAGWTNFFGGDPGPASGCRRSALPLREQGRNYVRMLKRAYPAVKAANPNAWILVGGLTLDQGGAFVRGIYEGGGAPFFDFMNIHTYGDTPHEPVGGRGAGVRALMDRYGDHGRPMWLTEFGAGAANFPGGNPAGYPQKPSVPHLNDRSLQDGPAYDRHQLDWWRVALDTAAATRQFTKLIGYHLHTDDQAFFPPDFARLPRGRQRADYGAGLLRADGRTPRPAFEYLKQRGFNRPIHAVPTRTFDLRVYAPGRTPAVHRHTPLGGGWIRVHDVAISGLVPTVVRFTPGTARRERR